MSDTETKKPKTAKATAPKAAASAKKAVTNTESKSVKAAAPKAKAVKTAKVAKISVDKSEKKPAPKRVKKPLSGATITVRQIGSPIRRTKDQQATLIGLGLNKMGKVATLSDTPSVRGMIAKIQHMVEVVT